MLEVACDIDDRHPATPEPDVPGHDEHRFDPSDRRGPARGERSIDYPCREKLVQGAREEGIVADMGSFHVPIAVESLIHRGQVRRIEQVLVDTGSEFTWIPSGVLEALGVEREDVLRFLVADGRVLERSIGMAIVHSEGARAPDWVVFAEEGDMTLLGARSLEGMNLRVDPRAKRLVSAGPIITAAA